MEKFELIFEGNRRIVEAEKMYVSTECIYVTDGEGNPVAIIPLSAAKCISKLGSQAKAS